MNNKRLILAPDIGSQLKHVSPGDAFLHYSRVGFFTCQIFDSRYDLGNHAGLINSNRRCKPKTTGVKDRE